MTSFDPVAYINEPRWRHSSLGLERTIVLLHKLGDPQESFLTVHVAGTNGKGSTCAYLASILRSSGLRTGMFTSPYIEHFEERIQVNGESIGFDELTEITLAVRDAAKEVEVELGEHPTEFELMCAIGFMCFARSGCDIAVVECGLGGRLDATNVVHPALSVITRIGLDHTDILGDTLAAIAGEKAGIIKPGVPVVSAPQAPDAACVIEERCLEMGSPLFASDFSELDVSGFSGYEIRAIMRHFIYRGIPYETRLLAAYQPFNAAVAIDAATVLATWNPELGISHDAIQRGIAAATWPGRFEVVSTEPLVVVDGAHNPDGAAALAQSVEELLTDADRRVTLVIGVLADKDWKHVLDPMLQFAQQVIAYAPNNPRALSASELAQGVRDLASQNGFDIEVAKASSAQEAITMAMEKESPEGIIIAFGTLYSIGAIKQAVRAYSSLGVSRP